AVFFQVNDKFQKAQGRPYLGSRDVDLGFHIKKDSTIEELKNSSLAKSIKILENKLKFKPLSFRLVKEIHTEKDEEIKEGEIVPIHFIFPMYIDTLVDNIPKNFKEVFKFSPADEPLLNYAFENEEYREELKEFNKKLWLPKPELLLATKLNALKYRDKEHKKIKDICDIFALIWYSKETKKTPKKLSNRIPKRLSNRLPRQKLADRVEIFITKKKIKEALSIIEKEDYEKASIQLNHTPEEIKRVIETLKE
ncbi:MAG: hypothetical protein AABW52_01495, partial [Nanoarchaeota archaeon]